MKRKLVASKQEIFLSLPLYRCDSHSEQLIITKGGICLLIEMPCTSEGQTYTHKGIHLCIHTHTQKLMWDETTLSAFHLKSIHKYIIGCPVRTKSTKAAMQGYFNVK